MEISIKQQAEEEVALFVAGQTAPPGTYQRLDSGREVRLECEDTLPASCDGHIAVFRRMPATWGDRQSWHRVFAGAGDQGPGWLNNETDLSLSSMEAHLQWGVSLYAQGHTQEALWDFFQSIGSDPQNPLGHYLCGLALKALGLGEEAQKEWETVLSTTSDDGAPLCLETQWARSMALRLLRNGSAGDRHSQ